jgi:carbonic anhydrase
VEFRWEPFGRTYRDEPAAPAAPPPKRATEPAPPHGQLPREPARRLAVLTCMDCRIDPVPAFGLAPGDAVVLRNAGAQVSDDVLRSLRLAGRNLGVTAVRVVGHTDCAANGGDDKVTLAEVERGVVRIGAALPELEVRGAMLDLRNGAVVSV